MANVIEVDAATGIVIERDFTPEELAQREQDAIAIAAEDALREAEEEAREAARASAIAKLTALGLDESEVAALLGSSL